MACGSGSGPSDPLLSCTLFGSASTRRLAKVVKLENFVASPSNRYDRFSREQMRSRVGSQVQLGRCAGEAPDGAQRPFQSRAQRGTSAACSVRQAPPFNGSPRPALPPPQRRGSAGGGHSIRYLFRVERGVDFRNFQPLQRSRRLNRTFRRRKVIRASGSGGLQRLRRHAPSVVSFPWSVAEMRGDSNDRAVTTGGGGDQSPSN